AGPGRAHTRGAAPTDRGGPSRVFSPAEPRSPPARVRPGRLLLLGADAPVQVAQEFRVVLGPDRRRTPGGRGDVGRVDVLEGRHALRRWRRSGRGRDARPAEEE